MPENDLPAAKSEPEAAPVEFDFAAAPKETRRVKKRSLKPKLGVPLRPVEETEPSPAARDLAREAPALSASEATPEYQPADEEAVTHTEPVPTTAKTTSQPHFASTARPSAAAQKAATTSPHGTRPATLYYSNNPAAKKEPTPAAATPTPTPTSPESPSPMKSTTTPAPATATRPASVVDYRANVDRQAREQKSVGGVLSILVYTLIAFFVAGAGLAGYGTYVLSKQIKAQSLTIDELDKHYASETSRLNDQIKTTSDALSQSIAQNQAQITQQQQLIAKQQELINKLAASSDANAAALRAEKAARAEEAANLRARLRALEYKGPTTQRY